MTSISTFNIATTGTDVIHIKLYVALVM